MRGSWWPVYRARATICRPCVLLAERAYCDRLSGAPSLDDKQQPVRRRQRRRNARKAAASSPFRSAGRIETTFVRPVESPTWRPLEHLSGTSLFPNLFPNGGHAEGPGRQNQRISRHFFEPPRPGSTSDRPAKRDADSGRQPRPVCRPCLIGETGIENATARPPARQIWC